MAAKQRNADAVVVLGGVYEKGFVLSGKADANKSVAKDDAEALRIYRAAAQWGHEYSVKKLGEAYLEGKGLQKDYLRAYVLSSDQSLLLCRPGINDQGAVIEGVDPGFQHRTYFLADRAEKLMTPAQKSEAKLLVRKCAASCADCVKSVEGSMTVAGNEAREQPKTPSKVALLPPDQCPKQTATNVDILVTLKNNRPSCQTNQYGLGTIRDNPKMCDVDNFSADKGVARDCDYIKLPRCALRMMVRNDGTPGTINVQQILVELQTDSTTRYGEYKRVAKMVQEGKSEVWSVPGDVDILVTTSAGSQTHGYCQFVHDQPKSGMIN